jgi:hypothetical protein
MAGSEARRHRGDKAQVGLALHPIGVADHRDADRERRRPAFGNRRPDAGGEEDEVAAAVGLLLAGDSLALIVLAI